MIHVLARARPHEEVEPWDEGLPSSAVLLGIGSGIWGVLPRTLKKMEQRQAGAWEPRKAWEKAEDRAWGQEVEKARLGSSAPRAESLFLLTRECAPEKGPGSWVL